MNLKHISLGWIGTGVMGGHLLAAGYPLYINSRPGAVGCWTLDNLAPRINREDSAPGFMVDHFVKDLGIALSEAEQFGLRLPGLQLAQRLYRQLQAPGHGQSGTQALVLALRAQS